MPNRQAWTDDSVVINQSLVWRVSRARRICAALISRTAKPRYRLSLPSDTRRLPSYNGDFLYGHPTLLPKNKCWNNGVVSDGQVTDRQRYRDIPDERRCRDFSRGGLERCSGWRSAGRRGRSSAALDRLFVQPTRLALLRYRLPAGPSPAGRQCARCPDRRDGIIQRSHQGPKVTRQSLTASLLT
jgi:hypothetical protein